MADKDFFYGIGVDIKKRTGIKMKNQTAESVAGHGVTDALKQEIIAQAVSMWDEMGMTNEQISFGIATMNMESGFNRKAKYPGGSATGLGGFTDRTWPDAVDEYNGNFRKPNGPKIDAEKDRLNADAQIKAMGAWTRHIWEKALTCSMDPRLADKYSIQEVAYALWHQGPGKSIDTVTQREESEIKTKDLGIKDYLDNKYNKGLKPDDKEALHDAYRIIHSEYALKYEHPVGKLDVITPELLDKVMEILAPGLILSKGGHGGQSDKETLKRDPNDYRTVWRIREDGTRDGSFESA